MIGQFGHYDHDKHKRDFKDSFFGVEACLFEEDRDVQELVKSAKQGKFNIGVHFPLRAGGWRLRDPQFLSKDDVIRKSSYEYIEDELEFLREIKPKYVLLHYPKPVLLDSSVDWTNWRFADDTEYYFESDYTFEDFKEKSERFFEWLDDISYKNKFTPVLELDAINRYIYDTDILEILLKRYPRIKLCLDVGRLHLQDKLDDSFDSYKFTRKFARYAQVIHLWNVKVTSNLENSHFPVLPKLKPEEGWADIEVYLSIIREENSTCKFLFEHRSDLITDEELECCYNWVNDILRK